MPPFCTLLSYFISHVSMNKYYKTVKKLDANILAALTMAQEVSLSESS